MAILRLTVDVDPQWTSATKLRVYVGDENALDLASSSGGGTLVKEVPAFSDPADTQTPIEVSLAPADPCAIVPYGVSAVDDAGNESQVFETFDRLNDVPLGVDTPPPEATANPNEARLDWAASPDV